MDRKNPQEWENSDSCGFLFLFADFCFADVRDNTAITAREGPVPPTLSRKKDRYPDSSSIFFGDRAADMNVELGERDFDARKPEGLINRFVEIVFDRPIIVLHRPDAEGEIKAAFGK